MAEIHSADLVRAARLVARDEATAEELLRELGPEMLGFSRRMLGDPQRAEDVVQETLLAALGSADGYDGRVSLRAWMYGILRHKIFDSMRRAGRERYVSGDDPELSGFRPDGGWKKDVTFAPWDENAEVLAVVQRCIDDLPHGQREALLLRTVEGLSSQEAADLLDLSNANLRQIVHRARQSVRRCADGRLGENR
ncbi:MAG TPA: sigma-70 family RNA polymerase sigma factor [Planctomycetota bacterium]